MANKKKKRFSFFKLLLFILIILILGYFLLPSLYETNTVDNNTNNTIDNGNNQTNNDKDILSDILYGSGSSYSSNWALSSNVGQLNNNVASNARAKRTKILGNNNDVVTIMVYMCGSDLESEAAMGIYDLQEMASAKIGSNVNLLVYTGGTTRWHLSDISTSVNQIYRVVGNGQIERLVDNAGNGSMVDPDTLVSFIEWSIDNYEANRYELIFWDHGGGSVSGYGYDTKYPNLGSMDLAKIDRALTSADVDFDFIGFDACLMANTETALMLTEHADYLIASEESEPGIGWYYTDWLTSLSNNTSMATLDIGKNIADSFVRKCNSDVPSQAATLSVIDLAEMESVVPAKLSAFSTSTNELLNSNQYKLVANARGNAREFAQDSYVDLVDLIDMANNLGTDEAKDLINTLLGCIKYNNTSRNISNSYGLSVYFPYRTNKYINTVLHVYDSIDMNKEYSDVVRNFSTYQTAGQASSGGSHNPYQSFNSYGQGYSGGNSYDYYYGQQDSVSTLFDLLEALAGGSSTYTTSPSYSDYYADDLFTLLFGRGVDRNVVNYIVDNHFDADLTWKDGKINLTEKQWSMVTGINLNVFVDDGNGYIDLGSDNVFEIDDNDNLLAIENETWLAASIDQNNWEVVPYYYLYEITDGEAKGYYGRIPVMLNGTYANLLVKIDDDGLANVIGVTYDYRDGVDVVAKTLSKLEEGDEIAFVCDYYDYNGKFSDTYVLGDKLTVKDQLYLGDVDISNNKTLSTYELIDIYNQSYWTTPMK